ncbi:hypothetical protein D3C80_1951460 [compost metagenome]
MEADLDAAEGESYKPFLLVSWQGCKGAIQHVQLHLMPGSFPALQLMSQTACDGQIPFFGWSREINSKGLRSVVLGDGLLDGFL